MAVVSFSRILGFWAQRDPSALALSCGDRRVTYTELDASTNRLARAYQELGVKEGDNVTIALPNTIEFVEACYAFRRKNFSLYEGHDLWRQHGSTEADCG